MEKAPCRVRRTAIARESSERERGQKGEGGDEMVELLIEKGRIGNSINQAIERCLSILHWVPPNDHSASLVETQEAHSTSWRSRQWSWMSTVHESEPVQTWSHLTVLTVLTVSALSGFDLALHQWLSISLSTDHDWRLYQGGVRSRVCVYWRHNWWALPNPLG